VSQFWIDGSSKKPVTYSIFAPGQWQTICQSPSETFAGLKITSASAILRLCARGGRCPNLFFARTGDGYPGARLMPKPSPIQRRLPFLQAVEMKTAKQKPRKQA
jgi:hypothetical protein